LSPSQAGSCKFTCIRWPGLRGRTATIAIAATAAAVALFCAGLLAGGAFEGDDAGAQTRPAAQSPAQPRQVRLPDRPPEERSADPTGVRAGTIRGELASRRKRDRQRRAQRKQPAAPRGSARKKKSPSSGGGGGKANAQSNSRPQPREQARQRAKKPRRQTRTQSFRSVAPPPVPVPVVPAPAAPVPVEEEQERESRRFAGHQRHHGRFSGRDGPDRRRRWW
jgi:hypothetical protein